MARAVLLGCGQDFGGAPAPPALTNDAGTGCLSTGPTSFIGARSENYWSSSASEVTPNEAWYLRVDTGIRPRLERQGHRRHLRVAGAKRTLIDSGRARLNPALRTDDFFSI
jgi:hypothetical protein